MLLVFNEVLKTLLKEALACWDYRYEALAMAKIVNILRKEMFDFESFRFNSSFPVDCQGRSMPPILTTLVSILLNGTNLKEQDKTDSQACLSISQMILFDT